MRVCEVSVEGEFIAMTGNKGRNLMPFKEVFILAEENATLYHIQRKLVGPRLKQKNENRVRKNRRFFSCSIFG